MTFDGGRVVDTGLKRPNGRTPRVRRRRAWALEVAVGSRRRRAGAGESLRERQKDLVSAEKITGVNCVAAADAAPRPWNGSLLSEKVLLPPAGEDPRLLAAADRSLMP